MAHQLAVFVPAEGKLDGLREQVPAKRDDDLGLGVGAGSGRVFLGALPEERGGARDGQRGVLHN